MSDTKELRVFISSTFRDLMPEREQLIKKTFPRIRAQCRERGVEFTEIDLRWGITDEESRTGKTIRICLEEIGRCPYFIGIIGSRYGWVPGTTELEKDPELLALFPWLREFADEGKSIVEMEFAHGALREGGRTAHFYAQQGHSTPSYGDGNSIPLAVTEGNPLLTLQQTIQGAGHEVRTFASPEELGEQVYSDLLALLDRDFPINKEETPLKHERTKHEAFAQNRRQSYVANPEYYDILEKQVHSTEAPLIVWGASGLGKSALMAHLAHEYKRQHPDAFVVEHYIGSSGNTDSSHVIRHILLEIKERYQLTDEIPSDDHPLREAFPEWLAKIGAEQNSSASGKEQATAQSGEKLILFIDALNQLTGIAREMHWLPEFIPENVRLVLSTTADVPLTELRKRNWSELEMKPLTGAQVQTIAKQFLEQYRKQLDFDQLALLSLDEKTQRPLFLRTMLEELRIHGSHSGLSDRIEHYLQSEDEADLFQRVLARLEDDHGTETVRSVMTAIWVSRFGLSEHEIIRVTGLARVHLSELLIAMEYHLMQREQLFAFFHNYLRNAVEIRYLASEEDKQAAHRNLAQYFAVREYAGRRRGEEPWQWREANDLDALWRCLADPEMFMLFANEEHRYHFIAYLQAFERERSQELFRALHDTMRVDASFDRRLELAQTARVAGYYEAATDILAAISDQAATMALDYKTSLHIKREWAQLYGEKHDYRHALPLCEEIVALIESNEGQSAELFNAMVDLSTVMHGVGDYAGAEDIIRQAIAFGDIVDPSRRLDAMQNRATLVLAQGESEGAIELHLEALEESRKLLGVMHPSTMLCSINLAAALVLLGRHKEALPVLNTGLVSIKNTLGDKHNWYLASLETLGRVYKSLGSFDAAIHVYAELVTKSITVYGEEAEKTLKIQLGIGHIYYVMGDVDTAFNIYSHYLPLLAKVLGTDHPVYVRSNRTWLELSERRSERGQID